LKEQGNEAFKAGKHAEAIDLYSQAIKLDESNHILYSNRSAAYLKSGDANKALEDANKCLELKVDFEKGYSLKGSVLHVMKKYNEAITTFEEGLKTFPDSTVLKKQMKNAKWEKALSKERARTHVEKVSMTNQKKTKEAESMSDFVKFAKLNLELQLFSLQARYELLQSLAEMSDDEKLELLFSLLDKDQDGHIDARELSDGIRKRNEGMSFAEGLERAIKFVAIFDTDHNAKLDRAEFKRFIDTMLEEMGASFHELAEFIILQLLFSEGGNGPIEEAVGELVSQDIDEAVKETSEFYDALTDERMLALFNMFDLDGSGEVDFKEVAIGLFKLSRDMQESASAAVELMIMLDRDDSRTLDFEEFARLILNIVVAGDMKFDQVADDLTLIMVQPAVVSEEELVQLIIADEIYNFATDLAEAEKEAVAVMDVLSYGKMHKLFDLWDKNGDGYLQYDEILSGMRKYQEAMDIDESVQRAALFMLAFDENNDQKLSKEEFALALSKYANELDVDIHEFIDFLAVVNVLTENPEDEEAYFKAISPQATHEIQLIQYLADPDTEIEVYKLE
jgi:Ca2+-binding EF-hand superfamily protein